jgi:hypothetical protein
MSCKPINHTSEEIRNILINKGFIFDVGPTDTFEDLVARSMYLNENKVLPTGENKKYRFFGYEIGSRVSEKFSKKAYEQRYGRARVAKEVERLDFIKQKDAGSRIHQVMAEIVNSVYNKRGDLTDIMRRASVGNYAINKDGFTSLVRVAHEQIREINKIQDSIDPTKKAYISVEQFIVDPVNDIGGSMDVFIIFSDMTHGRLDYKTAHSNSRNYANGQLTDELLSTNKVSDNELNMTEYGRIAKKTIGVKEERMVRLIPIHVRLGLKEQSKRSPFDIYTNEIAFINAGSSASQYLKPIPVSGEMTKYAGINKLLEKQWVVLSRLIDKVNNKKLSQPDRDRITRQISAMRKAIQKTVLEGDISDIITSANLIINELNSKVREQELLSDGKPNPKYLSDEELEELIGELETYQDIINNTHKYYGDLKTNNPKLYDNLKGQISSVSSNTIDILEEAYMQRDERIMRYVRKYAGIRYEDKDGHLTALEELPVSLRDWTRMSDIDHPIFKTGWGLVQSAYYDMRQSVKKMSEDLDKADAAVRAYAKANNISTLQAFESIIDTKKGRLVSIISPELIDRISEAYYSTETETASYELQSIFELKDLKVFKEEYETRLAKYKETQIHKYKNGAESLAYKNDIKGWIAQNDLINSNESWVNSFNRKYLKIQDKVEKANYSTEYKNLLTNKPLLDYYNMYVDYNNQFREILDIGRYTDLPPEFIAYIRKSMVDHLSMDKLNVVAAGREFFESLSIRDDDQWIADRDASGELKRTIPILFLTPLINKDGEIDNTRRSYDLTKNLLIFAKMAYNYKYMSEIEPKIIQLKGIMSKASSETPGTKIQTKGGKYLKGKVMEFATKSGITSDTYKAFEDLTDMYLYGIKFKESNTKTGLIDPVKTIMRAKSIYGKQTLGLAVIPSLSAYIAGNIAGLLESQKSTSYTPQNVREAIHHLVTDYNKYTALAQFFDIYSSDPLDILTENKSANWWSKIMTYRTLMYPLARADELMNDDILNRMACNWGIDTENKLGKGKNKLVRLNDPNYSTEQMSGIKTIWELTTIDDKTGKIKIEGLTDSAQEKENYLGFRAAVKATSSNIIGSLSMEDKARYESVLLYNVMMQFKNWMPGIVRERFGALIFDDKIQAAKWGRYRAAFKEFGLDGTDLENGFQLQQYMTKIFAPNLGKLILDIATFGLAPRLGLVGEKYVDSNGKERRVRTNIARARRMYASYIAENPHLKDTMTFENYLEVKEGQMRAALVELRTVLSFMIAIHIMGTSAGDDKKQAPYMANWASRFMFKNLTKAQSELTFMMSPAQLTQLIANPIPLTSMLTKALKTLTNGFDETRDLLFGENSVNDNTPMGYYLLQWSYGGSQVARLIELYKQYEKSPYMVTTAR